MPLQESLPDVQMDMDKVPNATFDEESHQSSEQRTALEEGRNEKFMNSCQK